MIRSFGLAVLAALWAAPSPVSAQAPAAPASPAPASEVVATIGGEPFTARELEEVAGARLFQLRTQQYQAQRQILEDEIGRRLLDREAAARKVTVAELLKQEVESKVAPVTEAEQKAFYAQNKARMGDMAEADALKRIEAGLRQQRIGERQADL